VNALPEIAVVVPAHNARDTLEDCLRGLIDQTLRAERYEVHVVDTGVDGAGELVAGLANSWNGHLIYHRAERRGPGRQRNLGIERISTPYVAFTDADCVPEPQWLEAGLPHLVDGASIVQGPTLTPNGGPPPLFAHAIYIPGPSPLYESCNIMFEAEAVRRAGGFSVDLFEQSGSHMGEDTELAWGIRRANGHAVFEPRAVVRHVIHLPDFAHHLRYEWQARFFPRLIKRVPELRGELRGGLFLGRRSVLTCAALAGIALGSRTRWGYALTLPYLFEVSRMAVTARDPGAAARQVVADTVREAGLISGSVRHRSPVL
jgi:glycosyltransferase involved in cell wall biosynthesis